LTAGDRLYASEDSQAGIAFTGRNFARLEPNSSLDVVSLSDRRTQVALRDGSAIFNIGELEPDELFEVATPYGAVDLQEPGLYEVGYNDDGSAFVSVLSGLAQVVGMAGSGDISKGEMLTLLGQTAAQVALSRIAPDYAGGLLDDYYGYQYPDIYDGRYRDYNAYLNDPAYYDPYNRYAGYRYVPAGVPGVYDLDRHGDWQNLDGYGHAWAPRVEQGWTPYREGYWTMDDPHGLTWVSNEPWGYAPYHYGRWLNTDGRWFWLPGDANSQPVYSPALVAFVPLNETNQIGWVPLGPADQYAPAYYDADWQPHYQDSPLVTPEQFSNLSVPDALTIVSLRDFAGRINPGMLARVDPNSLRSVRPVLDPFSNAMLRQASLRTANERRGFTLPPGLAKKLEERHVYTSAEPSAPLFREGLPRALRVEAVPEKQKKAKLQFRDERDAAALPEEARTKHEQKEERRTDRRAERQERAARGAEEPQQRGGRKADLRQGGGTSLRAEAERPVAAPSQRAQGERVGHSKQAQKQAERQRMADVRQQQRAVAAPQRVEVRPQQPQRQERPRPQAQHAPPGQMRKQQAPQAPAHAHGGGGGGQKPPKQHGNGGGGGDKGGGKGGGGKGKGRP
jgi:hypothetical protein